MLYELLDMTSNMATVAYTVGLSVVGYVAYSVLAPIKKDNTICDHKELYSLSGEGICCSKNVRLSVKQSNEGLLMVAPSNAGKSRRFIGHNINKLNKCSIIATDPSRELEKMYKSDKKKYIFNPISNNTIGYDPLKNCRNEFEVRKLAGVILTNGLNSYVNKSGNTNQQDWVGMATPLLAAYMLMNWNTKKYNFAELIENICTLPIISDVEKDKDGKVIRASKSIELEIMMSGIVSAITEFKSFKQVIGATQTLSSIRIVMNSCLKLFLDSNVKRLLTNPNLDISKIRQEESIIFIQIPEHHSDYYSPLTATFLTQLFDYLLENDGLQIYFLLDEFANIGIIPNIARLLSTVRKHSISIVAAIQSLNQLTTLYGENQGKELIELFKTMLVCAGLKDSAEYISNLIGDEEYRENETTRTRPLMTPSEIRLMRDDEMLIISKNKRPVRDKMMEILKDKVA